MEKRRSIAEIELAFIPGVVFDRRGYRIGYGGGYYDRFLEEAQDLVSVGLGYEFQVVWEVPRSKHDLPVDYLCTERGLRKAD